MRLYLFLFIATSASAFAGPTWEERSRSVVILVADTPDLQQLGSGIIVNRDLILTNEHVLTEDTIAHRDLIIRNLNGLEFKLSRKSRFIAPRPDYAVQKDFAFAKFLDPDHRAPQSPVKMRPLSQHNELTLVAEINGRSMQGQTQAYKIYPSGMLSYCLEVVPGLSGSPVFDAEGYFVALTRGPTDAPKLCGTLENPGYALPAQMIFSLAGSTIPSVRPYLRR